MEKSKNEELRNVMIPLAVAKPNMYKKYGLIGLVTLYFMCLISYFTKSILAEYLVLEICLILCIIFGISKIYDYFYRCSREDILDYSQIGVVIGFSNKLLILSGEEVINVYDTDEIYIRRVKDKEEDTFFSQYTSMIECKKNGKIISVIGVNRLIDYEGLILTADSTRSNEDLEIIYDDEEDEGDFEE